MEALVGDGHEDRAILAREIINQGYLWARDEAAAEAIVAVVCGLLAARIPSTTTQVQAGHWMFATMTDIASAAMEDGLIDGVSLMPMGLPDAEARRGVRGRTGVALVGAEGVGYSSGGRGSVSTVWMLPTSKRGKILRQSPR